MGSRLYKSHLTIQATMKTQTQRIGEMLDTLDTTLLPANQRPEYQPWSKQYLKSEWLRFMNGQYTAMQSKTKGLVNQWVPKMEAAHATQAEKDKWKDASSDPPVVLLMR